MSSKGKHRANSSKPASSSETQQDQELSPPVSMSHSEPVSPAQETMDQPTESMVSTPSSPDPSPLPESASPESPIPPTASGTVSSSEAASTTPPSHTLPIPPASEPMQYRAIGLISAKYVPSAKQFTRGQLVTDDGCAFNAVLLGRVMSLVKKHLDPEANHLWVVYPRTREKTCDLHVQIVGVWEPETLDRDGDAALNGSGNAIATSPDVEESSSDDLHETELTKPSGGAMPPKAPVPPKPPAATSAPAALADYQALPTPTEPEDGYFSIRGEIVALAQNPDRVTVKIQQSPRKGEEEGRSFRIVLMGSLEGRSVGHFWELNVRRSGMDLVVEDGQRICVVRPKKPAKTAKPAGRGPGGKPPQRRSVGAPRPTPRPVPASSATPTTDESSAPVETSEAAE